MQRLGFGAGVQGLRPKVRISLESGSSDLRLPHHSERGNRKKVSTQNPAHEPQPHTQLLALSCAELYRASEHPRPELLLRNLARRTSGKKRRKPIVKPSNCNVQPPERAKPHNFQLLNPKQALNPKIKIGVLNKNPQERRKPQEEAGREGTLAGWVWGLKCSGLWG